MRGAGNLVTGHFAFFFWNCFPPIVFFSGFIIPVTTPANPFPWSVCRCEGLPCCCRSLSCIWLLATPLTAAHQASLPFTIFQSLLKFMSTGVGDAIQPSHPLSSLSSALNLSQHQGLFQWVSSLHQVAKVLELQLQHQSFQWISSVQFNPPVVSDSLRPHGLQHARLPCPSPTYSGLISFRIDWFDLLALSRVKAWYFPVIF